jgi:hypothetical protein
MKTFLLSLVILGLILAAIGVFSYGVSYLFVFHPVVLAYSSLGLGLFVLWSFIYMAVS